MRVVAPSFVTELETKDKRHVAPRKWRFEKVEYCPKDTLGKYHHALYRCRRQIAGIFFNLFKNVRFAQTAYTTALKELTQLAAKDPADWFIAHAHAALPVAAAAAQRWNARLGFDCEDLLAENDPEFASLVHSIEREYLPRCDYVSVPSQEIANEIVSKYDIRSIVVLYNVFPLYLADGMTPPWQRFRSDTLRIHWASQTIGPGRGLEEAIEAAGFLRGCIELHLRGRGSTEYENLLVNLAQTRGVNLTIHPRVDHDDFIKALGNFDVGLALERLENKNAALTVSNKIGAYMLAGLAVAATDTPGQRELLAQVPGAGFLYPPGRPNLLAKQLEKWVSDRKALQAVQRTGWIAARQQFSWDIEQNKLHRALEFAASGKLRQTA